MILLDVNVLIYAHRVQYVEHAVAAPFLQGLLDAEDRFGVPEMVLHAFVRVVTQKFHTPPTPLDQALEFCDTLRSSPNCVVVQPGERHWQVFSSICRRTGVVGGDITDAYLAAFAIERDDEWVTGDQDFARFPGLRWRNLLDGKVRVNPR